MTPKTALMKLKHAGSSESDDDMEILLLDTTYSQSWTWTPSQPPRYRGNRVCQQRFKYASVDIQYDLMDIYTYKFI